MMYKMFLQMLYNFNFMLIIGIDPGITGAICFFEDGENKRCY